MRRLVLVGFVFALLGALLAPLGVSNAQTTATAAGPGIGTSVPIYAQDGSELGSVTINDVVEPFEGYDRSYGEPQRGYHYALVDVTVANTASRPFALDPSSFRAVDSDGFVASYSYVSLTEAGAPIILEYLDALAPGTNATGALLFEVFNDSSIERIVYSPDFDVQINVLDLREDLAVAGTPVPVIGSSGDAIMTVTVNGVSDPWEDFEEFDAPSRGTRYVLLDVTVVNNAAGILSVSPNDFVAIDDQGFVLETAYASTDSIGLPRYDYIDLEAGAEQRGSIVFQVFADIPVAQIIYGDGYSRSVVVADLSAGAPAVQGGSVATPNTASANPDCVGLEVWALDLFARVNASAELVAPLSSDDPASLDPVALRAAAEQFTTYAQEQTDSNPPVAAQALNDLFVTEYFTAMSSAIGKLADAVESNNTVTALIAQTEAQAVVAIFDEGGVADQVYADLETACPEIADL